MDRTKGLKTTLLIKIDSLLQSLLMISLLEKKNTFIYQQQECKVCLIFQ